MSGSLLSAKSKAVAVRLRASELDRRLAAGECEAADGALAIRATMLAGAEVREQLARALREIVGDAEFGSLAMNRVPLARAEVAAAAEELRLLASRLQAPGPVDPRGVAEVRLLLIDGRGPLYNRGSRRPLSNAISAARRALMPTESSALQPCGEG
jgi:hypothetical protein